MAQPTNLILSKMLDRLFAAMVNGPSLNCRPHASRQRIDLTHLARLSDLSPEEVLRGVLAESRQATLRARVAPPKIPPQKMRGRGKPPAREESKESDSPQHAGSTGPGVADEIAPKPHNGDPVGEDRADRAWLDQMAVFGKLRTIAEDAKTYEQDTGVHVLSIGFPMLSLPPGTFTARDGVATRRILAPIALIPVTLVLKHGAAPSIELAAKENGINLVTRNEALFEWLEQQTGKAPQDLFADQDGRDPWREIDDLTSFVAGTFGCAVPDSLKPAPSPVPEPTEATPGVESKPVQTESTETSADEPLTSQPQATPVYSAPQSLALIPAPRADDSDAAPAIVASAVLGLFPMANQGLLRDMKEMAKGNDLAGPVKSFIERGVSLERRPTEEIKAGETQLPLENEGQPLTFTDDRFVSSADPCQAGAARLARQCGGLVVHGPPGTGKSQTITNVIGDHLARGQRVLMVCDKRTALDVVANRLRYLGLGHLCAIIHDPQRDRRDLYRTLRQQLDELPETSSDPKAADKLAKCDAELQKLHGELTVYQQSLSAPAGDHGLSFHELVGQWLAMAPTDSSTAASDGSSSADAIPLTLLDGVAHEIEAVLTRAKSVEFPTNPWTAAAGGTLGQLMARQMDEVRSALTAVASAARDADGAAHPTIPPFSVAPDLQRQTEARSAIATPLESLLSQTEPAVLARWANEKPDKLRVARDKLAASDVLMQAVRTGPLDAELLLTIANRSPALVAISGELTLLASYLDIARTWRRLFAFTQKREAAKVLNSYGLTLSPENAGRCHRFLTGLRARVALSQLLNELSVKASAAPTPNAKRAAGVLADDFIDRSFADHIATLDLLLKVHADPSLSPIAAAFSAALRDGAKQKSEMPSLVEGLRRSPARASALQKLEQSEQRAGVFDAVWLADTAPAIRSGSPAAALFAALADRADTLEGVLRVREELAALPAALHGPVRRLIDGSIDSAEGVRRLRRESLTGEISKRLAADPKLQSIDGHRLAASFERYRKLEDGKRELVRDVILHHWQSRQRERLLATTGSRLNTLGGDLRRRLTMRGEHAMRLRKVVENGQKTPDGDPLFDLCPVWMCSPETVAQIFPRLPIFDLVVFDEASQCRLEEALPVLLRAPRVVIAGDPMQLPPTRFFESAVATSDDEELETDQQLFEVQQGEVEDLLEAALGLDIHQCYLDVHYRSRNSDLIAFSNEHFYSSRLQPIPAHPSHRADMPPLLIHRVEGIYEKRQNEIEAQQVVQIVRDLLRGSDQPSIGIACFNLPQRDMIVEALEEAALDDERFAKALARARTREGVGSFEGLFVKNLENVQGDERDHIIISTTYGPDPGGRFHRRFGPLARAGGGRRLNVLITRAREAVHLVTSIPPESYRNLPPLAPDQTPGGGYLLFQYLQFAEQIAARYVTESSASNGSPSGAHRNSPTTSAPATVTAHPTTCPSRLASSLAEQLATRHGIPSDLYWGNEGFCIDLALHQPDQPDQVTIGLLCDGTRYASSGDATEWDIFRTAILESQGWRLHRVWSPHFFRDPRGCMRSVLVENEKSVSD